MKVQTYKTPEGAERYAREIRAKFPLVKTAVISCTAFGAPSGFAVQVTVPDGRNALAGTRPRGYASPDFKTVMYGRPL